MSHASMLKARRQHQKTKKRLHVESKQFKRLAKQALAASVVEKENEKRVKPTKEELGSRDAKESNTGAMNNGAP
jgi:hypothetical protein